MLHVDVSDLSHAAALAGISEHFTSHGEGDACVIVVGLTGDSSGRDAMGIRILFPSDRIQLSRWCRESLGGPMRSCLVRGVRASSCRTSIVRGYATEPSRSLDAPTYAKVCRCDVSASLSSPRFGERCSEARTKHHFHPNFRRMRQHPRRGDS